MSRLTEICPKCESDRVSTEVHTNYSVGAKKFDMEVNIFCLCRQCDYRWKANFHFVDPPGKIEDASYYMFRWEGVTDE
jgi:hypothetical protein